MANATCTVALGLLLVLSGCGRPLQPSPPHSAGYTPVADSLPAVESRVTIPVRVDLAPMIEKAQSDLPREFSGGEHPCSGLRYRYTVERRNIKVIGQQRTLLARVSLGYGFKGEYCAGCIMDYCVNPPIPFSCGWDEPMRRMEVDLESKLTLDPRWRLITETRFTHLKPIDECRVTLARVNINDELLKQLKPNLGVMEKAIDREAGAFPLKSYIQPVWNALHEPIPLDELGWLHMKPAALSMADWRFKGTELELTLGLRARPVVLPEAKRTNSAVLPDLSQHQAGSGFQVYTDLLMPYSKLSQMMTAFMDTIWLGSGKNRIRITGVRFFPAGRKLGMELSFTGSKKGVLYLLSVPEVDNAALRLQLKELEYDLNTRNLMLKSAQWVLDEKIRRKLEQQLVFDVADLYRFARKSIEGSLNQQLAGGLSLAGTVDRLECVGYALGADALQIRVLVTGAVRARVVME